MVQQMIDAKVEYGLASNGTGLPICNKPQTMSAKKTALRDLSETQNIIPRMLGNSPRLKDDRPFANATKICGSKRSPLDHPPSSVCNRSAGSNGSNGHLVYVRRKTEPEVNNTNACNAEVLESPQQVKSSDRKQESHGTQNQEPKVACIPAFASMPAASLATFSSGGPSVPNPIGKLHNGLVASEPNCNAVGSGTPHVVGSQIQRTSRRYWEERFLRLQTFLRTCDQSDQEEYLKSEGQLRSLPAIDRSRHAYELERRAILLSLEEGKEIQRMKVLNVLGKASPKSYGPAIAQSHFQQSILK